MLVGYVSDEQYNALGDVILEFCNQKTAEVTIVRSSISGAVYADISSGEYKVILGKPGFGSKIVNIDCDEQRPHHFRLLSDNLFGYMWPKCVKAGDQSEFRVHSPAEYELELWRYGADKELIRRIGTFNEHAPRATVQISPDGDYTQTGITWNKIGFNSQAHAQYITAPEQSELYYLHARNKSGMFFSFPWVVAPAKPQAKLAVFASDINWNAYNSFGGRSNYIHADELPETPTINSRQELKRYAHEESTYDSETYLPLSFDRPEPYNHIDEQEQLTDPIAGRQGCHLAAAEWRLLGWLERKRFEYDFYSETQFHFEKFSLNDYKVVILSTHPEYWSADMYYRLKRWVFEEGGRVMYLGGNGLNCEVEFLDEQRIVYQNTSWKHATPEYAADGREYESRFDKRQESEANFLGVVFTNPGIMTAAPYRVLADDHWCFAETGLRNGDLFGTESLHVRVPGGASGHETDKISPCSPANVQLLARGLNPDNGGADMVLHEQAHGGAVFSVGSICWPSSVLVDEGVSQITENVLKKFLSE